MKTGRRVHLDATAFFVDLIGQRHYGGRPREYRNPKRKRGNRYNVLPRLRFGSLWGTKVAFVQLLGRTRPVNY